MTVFFAVPCYLANGTDVVLNRLSWACIQHWLSETYSMHHSTNETVPPQNIEHTAGTNEPTNFSSYQQRFPGDVSTPPPPAMPFTVTEIPERQQGAVRRTSFRPWRELRLPWCSLPRHILPTRSSVQQLLPCLQHGRRGADEISSASGRASSYNYYCGSRGKTS